MKRLNKKGFTLVELLAVIVILAIVVGITLVTVLPTLKNSRQKAFELTANTAADYFEKQYQLYLVGETESIPDNVEAIVKSSGFNQIMEGGNELKLAGLKPENYVRAEVEVNQSTGRACVILWASTNITESAGIFNLAGTNEAGEYYDATANEIGVTLEVITALPVFWNDYEADYSMAKSSACD